MASPKLKMYQLDPGYSEDGDTDIQQAVNDELLPVRPRSQLLTDAEPLTGIVPFYQAELQPVDLNAGRSVYPLGPSGARYQLPVGIDWEDVLLAKGHLGLRVLDSEDAEIDEDIWEPTDDGIHFTSEDELPPSGAQLSCYQKASIPAQDWALASNNLYDGSNTAFNRLLIRIDDGPLEEATPEGPNNDHVHLDAPADSVKASYAYLAPKSKFFCGDHPNWIDDHLWLRPDVFVGTKDYPGDNAVVSGVPYEPGPVPEHVNPSTYSLSARDGLVTFLNTVDSGTDAVKANYSYLVGVKNVTGQHLDDVVPNGSGARYKAAAETAYPDAHNRRWVRHRSTQMPLTIYVDGVITPNTQTVIPYDTLTPITG